MYVLSKDKIERIDWWESLTPEQQKEHIERKQALKAKKRGKNYKSTCTVFLVVTKENKDKWINRILAKNKWLIRKNGRFKRKEQFEPLFPETSKQLWKKKIFSKKPWIIEPKLK